MTITVVEYSDEYRDALVSMATELIGLMADLDQHHRFRKREEVDGKKYVELSLQRVRDEHGAIFIALNGERAVGYVTGAIDTFSALELTNKYPVKQGYINDLYIEESHRGQGVGTLLIGAVEHFLKSAGCEFVGVTALSSNEAARKLYEKMQYGEQYVQFLKKL